MGSFLKTFLGNWSFSAFQLFFFSSQQAEAHRGVSRNACWSNAHAQKLTQMSIKICYFASARLKDSHGMIADILQAISTLYLNVLFAFKSVQKCIIAA